MTRLIAVLAAVLAIAGCTAQASSDNVDLTEFAIDGPTTLTEGSHSLSVSNNGEFAHTLVVTDDDGRVVANTDLVQPGESVSLDLELDQGRYQFTCRIVTQIEGGEIIDHFEEGMSAMVEVG